MYRSCISLFYWPIPRESYGLFVTRTLLSGILHKEGEYLKITHFPPKKLIVENLGFTVNNVRKLTYVWSRLKLILGIILLSF